MAGFQDAIYWAVLGPTKGSTQLSSQSKWCKCTEPGYCERHKVTKNAHWFHLCQTRACYYQAWEAGTGPGQVKAGTAPKKKRAEPGLGDRVSQALAIVGVTDERVSKVLGRKCRCPERREWLNQLGDWAYRVLRGRTDTDVEELESLLGDRGK